MTRNHVSSLKNKQNGNYGIVYIWLASIHVSLLVAWLRPSDLVTLLQLQITFISTRICEIMWRAWRTHAAMNAERWNTRYGVFIFFLDDIDVRIAGYKQCNGNFAIHPYTTKHVCVRNAQIILWLVRGKCQYSHMFACWAFIEKQVENTIVFGL